MTRSLVLFAMLSAVLASPAEATLLPSRSLEELTRDAAAVVRGRVIAQRVVTDPVTERVSTLSTVAVDECYKGRDVPGAEVVVSQPGGKTGELSVVVAGAAPLLPGQEVVLFLADGEGSTRRLVGLAQGAWFVVRGPDGAARLSPERPIAAAPAPVERGLIALDEAVRRVRTAAPR